MAAEQNIYTNIVANADFSGLIANVRKATAALTQLQAASGGLDRALTSNIAKVNKSFGDVLRSTGQYSSHFVSLGSDVDKFGKSLDSGKLKLKDYFRTWQDHTKTTGGMIRELAKQQVQMQNSIVQPLGKNAQGIMQYTVHIPRGLELTKNKTALARQEMQIYNKVIQDGGAQLINWGKNTQWAGRQLTVGLTVPIAAFGRAAANAFKTADEQLVRLTKVYGDIAGTSTAELGKVRKEVAATAKELATAYGTSYNDTLALSADIAATGKTGKDLINSIKETTRLSVLGEVDKQEAMKATLAIQTAFKQNTDQLSESINFLNAVENQTSTSLADLIEAIPKAGTVVQGMGGSVKDLALYLTAMKEGGVDASQGANAIKSSLASLINPTKVATEMFKGFGIDLGGIVTKNAGNLTGTILELQSALDTLNPLQKQKAIEQLFGKFQFARMNALFQNLGKQGSQTLKVMDLMKASSQDLASVAGRELSQVTESASGKYRRALEGLKADLAGVGEQFLNINTQLINFVDGILKFVNKLPGPVKQLVGIFAGFTALAGPIIMLTGVLANFFGYIVKGVYAFKNLFKGGQGFKLLTPEIMAANEAGQFIEKTFYSDAEAASILSAALKNLKRDLVDLQSTAKGPISVQPTLSTVAGGIVMPGGSRMADPNHPLIGEYGTRASSHMNPVSKMNEQERNAQTMFGMVPGPIPVNRKIGPNPQMYMQGDLPKIPGLTSIGGASTGIVAAEAAKWHAMTGALSMQSEAELKALKLEVSSAGTVTHELTTSYKALLPQITEITSMAATEAEAIVKQTQAGKLTVEAARAKIVALNAQVEVMIAETTSMVAASQGRVANITTVPLTNQPVIDPATGKSNMKEMFHKGTTASLVDKIARSLGVKTSGGGYSTETTRPIQRRNSGGAIYYNDGSSATVPGPNVNKDVVPAMLTPGEFVVNREATAKNLPLLQSINSNRQSFNGRYAVGGVIQKLIARIMGRGQYSPELLGGRNLRLTPEEAAAFQARSFGSHQRPMNVKDTGQEYYYVGNWGATLRTGNNSALARGAARGSELIADLSYGDPGHALPSLARFLKVNNIPDSQAKEILNNARNNIIAKLNGKDRVGEQLWSKVQHDEYLKIAKSLKLRQQYLSSLNVPGQRRKHFEGNSSGFRGETPLQPYNVADIDKLIALNAQHGTNYMGSYRTYDVPRNYRINGEPTGLAHMMPFNKGGRVPGFNGGGKLFLGMIKNFKQVQAARAEKEALENAHKAVMSGRFSKVDPTNFGKQISPTSGHSFPVPGIGGLYQKPDGTRVFVKPVLDDNAALAEMRATKIAREAHGLHSPEQTIKTMMDPTDPHGRRRILVLESPYDPRFANPSGGFTKDEYFRQLVAANLRGDKDLQQANLFGNVLADVGPAGVFGRASGARAYEKNMPSMADQARINLLGVKGGARKFFAESTVGIAKNMTADEYHNSMMKEIDTVLPKLKATIASMQLNKEEKTLYASMINRLEEARGVKWQEFHGIHSQVKISPEKAMTLAAIQKMKETEALRKRQKGHAASLGDMSFKTEANGFNLGGLIGNVFKGKAMSRIGAGFGPTGAPKASMYESAPWGVNSLSIEMADKLFANSGLRKNTQKLLYDKFAAALAQEKPYGYIKDSKGALKNALEPESLDAVIRLAASNLISDRNTLKQLSPIDKDILRKKYLNWESKKDTPVTDSLKKLIFKLEGREKGGPVNAGQPYVVGEKGPELFVPRNSGGIIPKYRFGGLARGAASMAGGFGAQALLSKLLSGVPGGDIISMLIGFPIGQSATSAVLGGGRSMGSGKLMSKLPDTMTRAIGTTAKGTDGKLLSSYGVAVEKAVTSGSKWRMVLGRLALGMTRLNLVVGAGTIAATLIYKRYKDLQEQHRLNALGFGLTADAAQKAGLKYTDYNSKIKDVVENMKALKERNQLVYESMASSGTPLNLTIEQYKALKKEVKSVYGDQIKLINQTKDNKTGEVATRLKEELIAAGMSAEDATKKIYTMFKLSNKGSSALSATVGNKSFNRITDVQTAAIGAVSSYGKSTTTEGGQAQAAALNTAMTAIDSGISEIIAKSEKAAKADKTHKTEIISMYDAEKTQLERINNSKQAGTKITQATINELAKENPLIKEFANTQDTVVSLWQKIRLQTKGYSGDLASLTSAQTDALYKASVIIEKSVISQNKNGLLKGQYKELDRLTALQAKYDKAVKGQSVQAQINSRKEVESINAKIDAINKEAAARSKALQDQASLEDVNLQIKKKQFEYSDAMASGNLSGAAQAQLDIKGLVNQQQQQAGLNAIEEKRAADVAPLEKRLKALDKANQALSDAAALAGEKLTNLAPAIQAQKDKIDAVNNAISAFNLNLRAWLSLPENANKTAGDYIKTAEGRGGAALVTSTSKTAGVTVPKVVAPAFYNNFKGTNPADIGLDLATKTSDAITKALSDKGIIMGSGNIIINGKKLDGTPAARPNAATGTTFGQSGIPVISGKNLAAASKNAAVESRSRFQPAGLDTNYRLFSFGGKDYAVDDVGGTYYYDSKNKKLGARVKMASGGAVFGAGNGTSDSIPAMLSNGEYVINAKSVQAAGIPMLDRINRMAQGGLAARFDVPGSSNSRMKFETGGLATSSNSLYNINVTLNGSDLNPNDVAQAISREMRLRDSRNGVQRTFGGGQ